MRAGNIEPNCDFHIVSSTFGCTGKVTPNRSWGLVNSTYSWSNTNPAPVSIRAADTARTRMLSLSEILGRGQPTLDRNVRVVNQMGSRRSELEIDDETHGAEPQRARSEIPVESRASIGVRLREGGRRRHIVPDAGEAAAADCDVLGDVNEHFQLQVCHRDKRLRRFFEIPVGSNGNASQVGQRCRAGGEGTGRTLRDLHVIDIGEQTRLL